MEEKKYLVVMNNNFKIEITEKEFKGIKAKMNSIHHHYNSILLNNESNLINLNSISHILELPNKD